MKGRGTKLLRIYCGTSPAVASAAAVCGNENGVRGGERNARLGR